MCRTVSVYCDGCGIEHESIAATQAEMGGLARLDGWHKVGPCYWFCADCWGRGKRTPTTHVAAARTWPECVT